MFIHLFTVFMSHCNIIPQNVGDRKQFVVTLICGNSYKQDGDSCHILLCCMKDGAHGRIRVG